MLTLPATSGWAYTWSSTESVNTTPNCRLLTLPVVNAVSLLFHPDRLLSLCCVSTDVVCGFGGFVSLGGATLSLHVPSNRRTSNRGSLRLVIRGGIDATAPCGASTYKLPLAASRFPLPQGARVIM